MGSIGVVIEILVEENNLLNEIWVNSFFFLGKFLGFCFFIIRLFLV